MKAIVKNFTSAWKFCLGFCLPNSCTVALVGIFLTKTPSDVKGRKGCLVANLHCTIRNLPKKMCWLFWSNSSSHFSLPLCVTETPIEFIHRANRENTNICFSTETLQIYFFFDIAILSRPHFVTLIYIKAFGNI